MHLQSTHTPQSQCPQSHPYLESRRRSVREFFYGNSLSVKVISCFHRGAPSLMLGGILNATLSEVSTTGVTQWNLELLLRPNSPDSYQTQIQEYQILDWLHVLISLIEGELIYLVDKAKNVWLIVGQLPIKAGWWNALLTLRDFSRSNKHEDSHKEPPWFPAFPPPFTTFTPWFLAFPSPIAHSGFYR